MHLSTDPYKGVRDFYPHDQAILHYLFSTYRRVCEQFGYEEYNASLLEPTALYLAKSSQEIVSEQTYSFKDRGEREVTLRPEMTPTLARMVAAQRRELVFPLRWYSIPNVFRYEKPQRGRLREHWQLNVDLFGGDTTQADAEIITLAYSLLHAFGAKDSDFEIRVNDRKNMPNDPALLRLLDRKAKMSREDFEREATKLFPNKKELEMFLNGTYTENQELRTLITTLSTRGITNVRYTPDVVRGFDYYSGMVFEVFDTDPKNPRALFGGGRYDNLLDVFGVEKIPAVGFGAGDVTMRDFLETHNLLPAHLWPHYSPVTKIMLCAVDTLDITMNSVATLAGMLRERGIPVAVDFSGKKIGDQIRNADRRGIPYVIVIGDTEHASGKFKIKNLASGEEIEVASADAIATIVAH